MRQVLSTALVACIVGALAGASFGAVAQSPAEPPVSTTALNAGAVDGLSAVKATSQKAKRMGKLVATDAKGFLPSNIVKAKWGLIGGKPAFLADGQVGWGEIAGIPGPLADGQVGWGEIAGIPGGFADGVDDAGYVSATQPTEYPIAGSGVAYATIDTPIGTDVELTIIPKNPGDILEVSSEWWQRVDAGTLRHFYELRNGIAPTTFKVRTRVYNTGIAPAAFKKALKKVEVGVVTKAPKERR